MENLPDFQRQVLTLKLTDCIKLICAGVGFCAVLVAFYVSFYYNVIIAWSLYFLVASATPNLPWVHCNNSWNTNLCWDSEIRAANTSLNATNQLLNTSVVETSIDFVKFTPASEYFQ